MTAVRTARGWLTRHDPGLVALRRALRVTVAACVGFFVCEYVVGLSTLATYAVFGAIAVGVLSDVGGPPAQRTRTYLGAYRSGWCWSRSAPPWRSPPRPRSSGCSSWGSRWRSRASAAPASRALANGLQLFYVLPCFPPYDPDSLPQRLVGLVIGIGLVTVADRLLWPAGAPPSFRERLADAADAVARYVTGLPADGPREAADAAVRGLRAAAVPAAVRPTGPGLRDRGLTHAAAELRTMVVRAELLAGLLPDLHDPAAQAAADALLAVVGDTLARCAAALRGTGPPPESGPIVAGIADYLEGRADRIKDRIAGTSCRRCCGSAGSRPLSARPPAGSSRGCERAPAPRRTRRPTRPRRPGTSAFRPPRCGGAGSRPTPPRVRCTSRTPCGSRWASRPRASPPTCSTSRTGSGCCSRRSPSCARRWWRAGWRLVPAFLGTLGGAFVAAGVLALVGDDTIVYAVVLPIAMLVSFAAGPLLGPAAGQFGFTVVVSVLFAQLAPTTWRLAEVRLMDVVIGGLIGALIGAAVWPRGGSGEIRRSAALCLRSTADDLVATVRALAGVPPREAGQHRMRPDPAHRVTVLFDITYAQYRSEPARDQAAHDWLDVLAVVQRASSDAEILRDRYPAPDPLPWPTVSRRLIAAAEDVARAFREAAGALGGARARPSGPAPGGTPRRRPAARPVRRRPARHPARHRRLGLDARPVRGPHPSGEALLRSR